MADDEKKMGEEEPSMGRMLAQLITEMKTKEHFTNMRGHLAAIVPQFLQVDAGIAYTFYCAGRVDAFSEMTASMETHDDVAGDLLSRALIKVSDAVGQTTEDFKARVDAAEAQREKEKSDEQPQA